MGTKFVHAADLHIDSPLRGLERYEGAPSEILRGATRRAFSNLITLCLEEGADLLLLAGDLFDDDWRDYGSGLFFANELKRLREAGVRVVWVRGNHDAASKITRYLKLGEHVRELSVKRPETAIFDDLGIAVHGQGFPTAAVSDDLADRYPAPCSDLVNVGLLHTAVDGREGHARYAPCRLTTLVNKGYDYWALGHVHQREVLNADPWVVFPGNLQGRHARELGAKGACIVTLEHGRVTAVDACALDVVRWQLCRVDASDASSVDDVVELARSELEREAARADGRLLAARVVLSGATRAHVALQEDSERLTAQIRACGLELGAPAWVEKVRIETRAPLDLERLRRKDDATGQLARSLALLREDADARAELLAAFTELRQKLPSELRRHLEQQTGEGFGAVLDDVEQLLLPRLLALEET
jgi:DNA repair protein SbcD/Mre11